MRLDQYLRASRLVLRRTQAQELCAAGAVYVNDKPAKSAREINPGDQIELRYRQRTLRIRVVALPRQKQTSRDEALTLYEIIADLREVE
ncbi:MAG TPA: S4 domain-containing protein [Pyrinomonadaceae bacterium]|jgi:ribosomal 50S subunit-recycling heat shock protein|nr:S4 domain-containing protein [Pyrinomonadaceae bacterium]